MTRGAAAAAPQDDHPNMRYEAIFVNGGFILVSDYVRMEVTQIGASWDVVAGVQTGLLLFKCA